MWWLAGAIFCLAVGLYRLDRRVRRLEHPHKAKTFKIEVEKDAAQDVSSQ